MDTTYVTQQDPRWVAPAFRDVKYPQYNPNLIYADPVGSEEARIAAAQQAEIQKQLAQRQLQERQQQVVNRNGMYMPNTGGVDAVAGAMKPNEPTWWERFKDWNREMAEKVKGYNMAHDSVVDPNTGLVMPDQYGSNKILYTNKPQEPTFQEGVTPTAALASSVAESVVDSMSAPVYTTTASINPKSVSKQTNASGGGDSKTATDVGGGYSTMTPIQFAQLAPHQVPAESVYDDRLAYQNGQTTRRYYFDNGQPVNFTNNPHFNNGSDPNYSSWSGLNMGANTPLSLAQQTVMARMLGQNQKNMAGFRSAQAQSAIQEAMNDPRTWQATKQLLEQGVPMQEAQYAAISQVLDNNGQMGALQMVVPQYAEQAAQRQGNQGALAGMFGMDYEAQPNLYGVTSPIASIQTNGDTTAIQLGNARYNIPTDQMPMFMQQIAALPNGPQLLSAMTKGGHGLTYEERRALKEYDQANREKSEAQRQAGREELQKRSQDFKKEQAEAKNKSSNVVGSTRF
nr:MAG TPA: hypothetical protein [Caudoviricetes sp.]